jgi:hypothetical protein
MALIDLKTNLKSLKYGRDTVDGGDSKQPLVKTSIPESFAEIGNTGGFDSTLRGGTLIGTAITNDSFRIGKLINTLRVPQGAAFRTKMNLLSNLNVKTQVNTEKHNQGNYQTRNTLAQVATDPFGYHYPLFSGPISYFDAVKDQQIGDQAIGRLVDLYDTKVNVKAEGTELYSYDGGPGSQLGFGKTVINLAGNRTGVNNVKLNGKFIAAGVDNKIFEITPAGTIDNTENYFDNSSVTRNKVLLRDTVLTKGVTSYLLNADGTNRYFGLGLKLYSAQALTGVVPQNGQGFNTVQSEIFNLRQDVPYLFTQEDIQSETVELSYGKAEIFDDFRKIIKDKPGNKNLKLAYSNYFSFNRKSSGGPIEGVDPLPGGLYAGDPGTTATDPAFGIDRTVDPTTVKAPNQVTTDWINYSDIQTAKKPELADNDYIPFYISILKYDGSRDTIQFRAFVEGFSDSYKADWSGFKYLGRGENFYNYNGFDRSINLSFTVHAQSKAELLRQYQKLNRLAASLAPDYSGAGIMRGNFMELTFGDYIVQQPGILMGLNFNIPDNSPYEIGRTARDSTVDENNPTTAGTPTEEGNRLAHIIKVEGFSFQPIHNFIPQRSSKFISLGNLNQGYGGEAVLADDEGFDTAGAEQGEYSDAVAYAKEQQAGIQENQALVDEFTTQGTDGWIQDTNTPTDGDWNWP